MEQLKVGYSRVDFTPEMSVPLAGYGNTHKRMSQGYYSRIYTTCIAITIELHRIFIGSPLSKEGNCFTIICQVENRLLVGI